MQLPAALFFTEENSSCAGSDHRFTWPTRPMHVRKSIKIGQEHTDTFKLLAQTLTVFLLSWLCLSKSERFRTLSSCSNVSQGLIIHCKNKKKFFPLNLPIPRPIWCDLLEEKKPQAPICSFHASVWSPFSGRIPYSVPWGLHRNTSTPLSLLTLVTDLLTVSEVYFILLWAWEISKPFPERSIHALSTSLSHKTCPVEARLAWETPFHIQSYPCFCYNILPLHLYHCNFYWTVP